jgi:hypothetical protein
MNVGIVGRKKVSNQLISLASREIGYAASTPELSYVVSNQLISLASREPDFDITEAQMNKILFPIN